MIEKQEPIKVSDIKLPEDKGNSLFTYGISQSMLNTYQTCRRKFLFTINFWEPVIKSETMHFGNIFHDLLDRGYREKLPPSPKTVGAWVDEYLFSHEADFAQVKPDALNKTTALVHLISQEYSKYRKEDWTGKQFTNIEQEFKVDFHGFKLNGRIDAQFRDKGGDKWNMEHKTKGRIEEDFMLLALSFDVQNLMYIIASEILTGEKIRGTLYNVVRTPGQHHKKNESIENFTAKILKDIRQDPDHYFKRYEIFYTEQDKEEFREELFYKLEEMKQLLEGKLHVYKNETACNRPYKCQFLEACSSGVMAGYRKKERKSKAHAVTP